MPNICQALIDEFQRVDLIIFSWCLFVCLSVHPSVNSSIHPSIHPWFGFQITHDNYWFCVLYSQKNLGMVPFEVTQMSIISRVKGQGQGVGRRGNCSCNCFFHNFLAQWKGWNVGGYL